MIRDDITIDAYHDGSNVSHSKIITFDELGPLGYFGRHVSKNAPRSETAPMRKGQRFEDFLMGWEPEVFPFELADPAPEPKKWNANRKACKAWLAEHPDETPPELLADPVAEAKPWDGKRTVCRAWADEHPLAISQAQLDTFTRMRDAVMGNATARAYIELAQAQLTVTCDYPGLPGLQTRPDFLVRDSFLGHADVNLKMTADYNAFHRRIRQFHHDTQAGLASHVYASNGMHDVRMWWLVVEEQYPHRAQLVPIGPTTLATGERWCLKRLDDLAEHYEADHWPLTVSDVADEYDQPVWGVGTDEEAD